MKPESLFYRLSKAAPFLSEVLARLVSAHTCAPCGFRILIVDATTISGDGATGVDWRVHVGYDPARGVPCSVCVPGAEVGESFKLHPFRKGDLLLGDRMYGTARNYHEAMARGADLLVRVQSGRLRVYVGDSKVNWTELESQVPSSGARSFEVRMPVPPGKAAHGNQWKTKEAISWHDVRLIGARNLDGEVVWLMTNLGPDRLSDEDACSLYRTRWQVELFFKRLKSLGDLGKLPSRDGPTTQAHLLAKLILLVLTSFLCDKEQAFSPYGYRVRATTAAQRPQPVARVRLYAPQVSLRASA
jgi:hypothetical protein